MKKPQCEKVLPLPESCCGCPSPRFDCVSRQLQNVGLVGRTARAVWLQRVQVVGKKTSEYQGLVLEQHVHPSLLVDHVACKEAMFQPLNVVIAKQGTVILMVSLLTRTLA